MDPSPRRHGVLPYRSHTTWDQGPAEVHLEVEFDWNLEPAYNVIATMAGAEHPRSVDHQGEIITMPGSMARRIRSPAWSY